MNKTNQKTGASQKTQSDILDHLLVFSHMTWEQKGEEWYAGPGHVLPIYDFGRRSGQERVTDITVHHLTAQLQDGHVFPRDDDAWDANKLLTLSPDDIAGDDRFNNILEGASRVIETRFHEKAMPLVPQHSSMVGLRNQMSDTPTTLGQLAEALLITDGRLSAGVTQYGFFQEVGEEEGATQYLDASVEKMLWLKHVEEIPACFETACSMKIEGNNFRADLQSQLRKLVQLRGITKLYFGAIQNQNTVGVVPHERVKLEDAVYNPFSQYCEYDLMNNKVPWLNLHKRQKGVALSLAQGKFTTPTPTPASGLRFFKKDQKPFVRTDTHL